MGRAPRVFHRSAQIFHAVFLGALLLIPLARGAWDPWSQAVVQGIWSMLAVLEGLLLLRGRPAALEGLDEAVRRAGPILGLYVGAGMLSALASPHPVSAWPAALNDVPSAAFFLLAASCPDALRLHYLRALAGGALLPLAAGGIAAAGDPGGWLGSLVNPNLAASLAVTALPLAAFLSFEPAVGPRERWVWRAGGIVALAALALSRSAWGYVVLAIAVLAYAAVHADAAPRALRWKKGGRIAAALVAGLLLFAAVPRLVTGDSDRRAWWGAAASMIRDRPLLGVGPGAYGEAYPAYRTSSWGLNTLYAHNALLETAAERGVPGALALLALGIAAFRPLARLGGRGRALAVGAGSFALYNAVHVGFSFPGLSWSAFALFGLLWGESRPPVNPVRRPRRGWGATAVALGVLLGAGGFAVFRADQWGAMAAAAFRAGRWTAARENVDRALRWNPGRADLYDLRAGLRLREGDVEGAWADMERCLSRAPASAGFHHDAAELALRRGRTDEAMALFDRAVRLMPLNPSAWIRRGDVLRGADREADARASYEGARRALSDPRVLAAAPETKAALIAVVESRLAGAARE